MPDPLLRARAHLLHDLGAYGLATPEVVSLVEDAVSGRHWWVQEWPQGATYVAGQVAQDVQDRLLESSVRWPLCLRHIDGAPHELHIEPELGADPHWVCELDRSVVAALGAL